MQRSFCQSLKLTCLGLLIAALLINTACLSVDMTSLPELEIFGKDISLDGRRDSCRVLHVRYSVTPHRDERIKRHNEHGVTGFSVSRSQFLICRRVIVLLV